MFALKKTTFLPSIVGLLFIILTSTSSLNAQNQKCYEQISIKDFLYQKVDNDTNFIRAVYTQMEYPLLAKQNEIQARIEVLLIYHGDDQLEVIQITPSHYFSSEISKLSNILKNIKFDKSHAFMTRFFVYFQLDQFRYKKKDFDGWLANSNTIVFGGYIIPMIDLQY